MGRGGRAKESRVTLIQPQPYYNYNYYKNNAYVYREKIESIGGAPKEKWEMMKERIVEGKDKV